jgi:hypothetical protein
VRTKQTIALLINGADRLLVGDCRPNQPVHIFHCRIFAWTTLISFPTIPPAKLSCVMSAHRFITQ